MTGPDQRFSGPFFRHRTGLFRPYSVDTTYLTAATYSPADLAVFVGILVIGLVVPFMAPAYAFQIAVLYLMVVFALTWDIMGGQMGYNSLGKIPTSGGQRDVASLTSSEKLKEAGIAYILQDKSVFPSMTVEENLWMGGYLMDQRAQAKEAAERVFDKYPRLAERRRHQAKVLSGGERRLLEISRALVMNPDILLVDEPSIGLEPRFIDMVFEIFWTIFSMAKEKPFSWSSKMPKRAWISPISAMSWFPASWRLLGKAMTSLPIPMSVACSLAAELVEHRDVRTKRPAMHARSLTCRRVGV